MVCKTLWKGEACATQLVFVGLVSQVALLVSRVQDLPHCSQWKECLPVCRCSRGSRSALLHTAHRVSLAHVGDKMAPQLWQFGEGVTAETALVGFLARATGGAHAGALLSEVLRTSVRPLACVQMHTVAQRTRIGQAASTNGTLASLGMRGALKLSSEL